MPAGPARAFARACLAVDASMLALAALGTAWSRGGSGFAFPPAGWVGAYCALTLVLYWSWRLYTFRTKLRPFADSLLIAGATSLAAMAVLTIRSLDGQSGVADAFLPLWAFAAVYGVTGRVAFYLFWTMRAAIAPEPAATRPEEVEEPEEREVPPLRQGPPLGRHMEVVPLRPELWGVLDELGREVDAIVEEQYQAEFGGAAGRLAEAG